MCDTLVALSNATADGSVILAKNSDRAPNEAQYPVYVPRTKHTEATVRCTHIEVAQVPETFAVLLSKPFWMWGCEMGTNEHGVAIGNEAVFTKEPLAKTGLLGMDIMRLALERADTARAALDTIAQLLETYGQGGACSIHRKNVFYHNSFIIADPGEAWVLETAGRYWAAKRVDGVYSISNRLSIGADFDLSSPGLAEHAVERGWCATKADLHFARCYSDHGHPTTRSCTPREEATRAHLKADRGRITVSDMFAYLRDHGRGGDYPAWAPSRKASSVCMHAVSRRRNSQSTASLVAHLRHDMPVHWMTGTSAPCTGVFKPFYMGPVPELVGAPTGEYSPDAIWWAHERLHRAAIEDYAARLPLYRKERDELETALLREERTLYDRYYDRPSAERAAALAEFSSRACERAATNATRWETQVVTEPARHRPGFLYRRYWRKQNEVARLPR